MKKRIFLIISTILCAVVSFSSVVYAGIKNDWYHVVKNKFIAKKDETVNNTSNKNNEDVGFDNAFSQDVTINCIVGDEIEDLILLKNVDQLDADAFEVEDSKITAIKEGVYEVSVNDQETNTTYKYSVCVWSKGSGTEDDPFNIVRPQDLKDLMRYYNNPNVYYVQQCDFDLSEYESWVPVGSAQKRFCANYDGNGKKILNMNIVVTQSNLNEYLTVTKDVHSKDVKVLALGFFGFVNGTDDKHVTIKNVQIENVLIDTTAIDLIEENRLALPEIYESSIGLLAGRVVYADVEGCETSLVSGTINASISCDDINNCCGTVAGLIGFVSDKSRVSGYSVEVEINANGIGTITRDGNWGALVGGIAGLVWDSSLENCQVDADVYVYNYMGTAVGGVAHRVMGGSVKDVVVNSLNVVVRRSVFENAETIVVCGAFESIEKWLTTASVVENVAVNNLTINTGNEGTTVSSGFADYIDEDCIVKNCSVNNSEIQGSYAFAFANNNYGKIEFGQQMSAVCNVEVSAYFYASAFVGYNGGVIYGGTIKSLPVTTITDVNLHWIASDKYFWANKQSQSPAVYKKSTYMQAGLAVQNDGQISNIKLENVKFNNAVNAGALVGYALEGKSLLENIDAKISIGTLPIDDGKSYSGMTGYIGGIVCMSLDGSEVSVKNVDLELTVNNFTDCDKQFSLGVFAPVCSDMYGKIDCDANCSIRFNVSSQVADQLTGKQVLSAGVVVVTSSAKVNYTHSNIIKSDSSINGKLVSRYSDCVVNK